MPKNKGKASTGKNSALYYQGTANEGLTLFTNREVRIGVVERTRTTTRSVN
jgi:hypothetical protein